MTTLTSAPRLNAILRNRLLAAMILNVYVSDNRYQIDVPDVVLDEGDDFFSKMDADMDRGWQMSRYYVESPDPVQRCQIAADRILSALHTSNEQMAMLMAGYILHRMPNTQAVDIDTNGEIFNTELILNDGTRTRGAAELG